MVLEDRSAAPHVWEVDVDDLVESAWSGEGLVEGLREVGGADDDDAGRLGEAVKLDE